MVMAKTGITNLHLLRHQRKRIANLDNFTRHAPSDLQVVAKRPHLPFVPTHVNGSTAGTDKVGNTHAHPALLRELNRQQTLKRLEAANLGFRKQFVDVKVY
jgi:hypothetical protein